MLATDHLTAFSRAIRGRVITPDDDGYGSARSVWNGMIDRRPSLIVEAGDVDDVAPTIALARSTGLPLAIRGGGHSVAGNGTVEGGIVLDLGRLDAVEVDPVARLVDADRYFTAVGATSKICASRVARSCAVVKLPTDRCRVALHVEI